MARRRRPRRQTVRSPVDRYVEQHGQTEPHTIWDSGRSTATGARRRISDAALMRSLDTQQLQAAAELEAGWRCLARALGARTASLEGHVDGTQSQGALAATAAVDRLVRWGQACTTAVPLIDYATVRAVICDGTTLGAIDRQARRRHGWALRTLQRGLDLWSAIRSRRENNSPTAKAY